MEILRVAPYGPSVPKIVERPMRLRIVALSSAVVLCATLACDRDSSDSPFGISSATEAFAMSASSRAIKPTIVLVHGAFADATSFQELIPLLQEKHYPVIAVQNTLTGLDADIVTTKRLIDAQKGPEIGRAHVELQSPCNLVCRLLL